MSEPAIPPAAAPSAPSRPQRTWLRRAGWSVLGMAACAAALLVIEVPSLAARDRTPRTESPWSADYFPNPVLTAQDGRKVRFYDDLIKGKSVAINTFFTVCTDVCPLSTAKMLELQRQMGQRVGKDIHFYSLSIDPIGDTPQSLQAYAQRYGVGPGWTFLTGRPEDIQQITRKLGLGVVRETDPREAHSSTLMVGDEPSGRWMKHSSTDNPQFVAASVATFLGWPLEGAHGHQREARTLNITNGEFLFRNACLPCHSVGQGDKIGPDLLGVHGRRPRAWLEQFVQAPDRMLAAGDPTAQALLRQYRGVQMPNLDLAREDVIDILDYIQRRGEILTAGGGSAAVTGQRR